MIDKAQRWQTTAITAAVVALLGMASPAALALSLGRITVQSALGEPLRAEIDVPDISADEANSLKAAVAPPEAFTAAGLEYHPEMGSLQLSLQRRADGRSYLRINSIRPINEPFVDMILVATWSAGRIVRDYTMLLDPPSLKQAAPAALPQTSAAAAVPFRPATPAPAVSAPVAAPRTSEPATAKAPAAPKAAATGEKVTVKAGDTASKIANRIKPADVSLDQMLVALIRSNPDAFMAGNLNRLRAGAVLEVPDAQAAKSVSPTDAAQQVIAQSKDFNEYRRSLATAAPKVAVEGADRKASGKVEAKVDDKKPAGAAPDKLTLSKGAVQPKVDEAKIAKERADKDAAARAAELAKNIADLSKVGAAAQKTVPAGSPASSATAAAKPATPAPAAAPAAPAPAAKEPAKAPAATTAPAVTAPAVTAPAAPPVPAVAPAKPATPAPAPAVETPGLLDDLLADPLVPAAAGGLVALLAGFGFYRSRKRKAQASHMDSSFLESRLQPDSFFGASGGQHVETGNEPNTGSGTSTSSVAFGGSMLDAADDVDPVAEADVYLAYGRDAQAEEILKEALRHHPERLSIHVKLLSIYAKRRDAAAFQAGATQAFKLTEEGSPEWTQICDMGNSIDPENRLYQPGGATPSALASLEPAEGPALERTQAMQAAPEAPIAAGNVDLDLDLDFSANDAPADEPAPSPSLDLPAIPEATAQPASAALAEPSLDFDISAPAELTAPTAEPAATTPVSMDGLDLDLPEPPQVPSNDIEFDLPDPVASAAPEPAPTAKSDDGLLNFDLGSLSLDLETPAAAPAAEPAIQSDGEDPLETKLALAEEFVSIGDTDGARALIEEVIAEASGDLRTKAERALANLS